MPTLSAVGWVSDTPQKLDFALAHTFEAEAPQSYLARDKVCDIQAILARNSEDVDRAASDLQKSLESYLGNIFDFAQVDAVNVNREKNDPSPRVTIRIEISVKDKGKVFNAVRMFAARELGDYKYSRFQTITDAQNYGL